MPTAPDLSAFSSWVTTTTVTRWHGRSVTNRSTKLVSVDQVLAMYIAGPDRRPFMLELLHTELSAWLSGKTTKAGALNTSRNNTVVLQLKRLLDIAVTLTDPLPWDPLYPGIFIGMDTYRGNFWVPDDFVAEAKKALTSLESKPVGKALLAQISKACQSSAGRKKCIIEWTQGGAQAAPVDDTSNAFRKTLQPVQSGDLNSAALLDNPGVVATANLARDGTKTFVPGRGCSAVVKFNHHDPGADPKSDPRPPFIALGHELIHALHYLTGNCYRAPTGGTATKGNTGLMEEEMRTVGFGKYASESMCENAIRVEHGIARRDHYAPHEDWTKVVATPFA